MQGPWQSPGVRGMGLLAWSVVVAACVHAPPPVPRAALLDMPPPHPVNVDGMIHVPGGPFFRGSTSRNSNPDERPGSRIDVPPFLVDRFEASAAELAECVRHGACSPEGLHDERLMGAGGQSPHCTHEKPGFERHPANCIDWYQARALCAHLGKRLPTEVEWEKAMRGSLDDRPFPWGMDPPGPSSGQVANVADESARRQFPALRISEGYDDGWPTTAPVDSFPEGVSPHGAHNGVGNVSEWTASQYDPAAYVRFSDEAADVATEFRVVRGSAWDSDPRVVRLSRRWVFLPTDRLHSIGVRCAADLPSR